jgi:hypothetical protein
VQSLKELEGKLSNPTFIIGGGPSLKGKDLSELKGKSAIGVNYDMFRPETKIGIFADLMFYKNFKYDIQAAHIPIVTMTPDAKKDFPFLYYMEKTKVNLLDLSGNGLAWFHSQVSEAGNTGAAALNLAVVLGIREVVLIGFDMKETEGRRNHHDAYGYQEKGADPYGRFIKRFESFLPDLEHLGVKVYNSNLESAMECFPKKRLEDFL